MSQGKPTWREPVTREDVLGKVVAALGVPFDALHATLRPQAVGTGNTFLMAPLGSVEAVSSAIADTRLLNLVERELDVLGVFFFAFSGDGRIRARMFAPGAGVPEDPATGSAAGPLGIYLALHHALPAGSPRFFIDQGVEMGRSSELEVEVARGSEGSPEGVTVAGSAVVMMRGTIDV
jgi:trans-2,3-dihydro-3-hydroxyanthranilate isomerase